MKHSVNAEINRETPLSRMTKGTPRNAMIAPLKPLPAIATSERMPPESDCARTRSFGITRSVMTVIEAGVKNALHRAAMKAVASTIQTSKCWLIAIRPSPIIVKPRIRSVPTIIHLRWLRSMIAPQKGPRIIATNMEMLVSRPINAVDPVFS